MNNPQRCFSCNKILGNLWETYDEMKIKEINFLDICKKLGIERYCCKRMFLSQKNFYDSFSQYTDKNLRLITINYIDKHHSLYHTK